MNHYDWFLKEAKFGAAVAADARFSIYMRVSRHIEQLPESTGRIAYVLRKKQNAGYCEVCGQTAHDLFEQISKPEIRLNGKTIFLEQTVLSGITGHTECLRRLRIHSRSDLDSFSFDKSGGETAVYHTLPFSVPTVVALDYEQLTNNFAKLPHIAYFDNSQKLVPTATKVLLLKRGERGYTPLPDATNAMEMNARLKVDRYQVEAMFAGSMFGWDVRGADPDVYRKMSTENVDKYV